MSAPKTYTVVGVYRDPLGQRYAQAFRAASPREAEEMAPAGLLVAAVLEGELSPLDLYTDGCEDVPPPGSRPPSRS